MTQHVRGETPDDEMRDAHVAYHGFEGASLSRRVWSMSVLMPTAFMAGYGFTWGIASSNGPVGRSPLFDVMFAFVPSIVWGVSWLVVGTLCFVGGVTASWQWLRIATVAAWALSSGLLFSVLWARFAGDQVISFVGISWVYALWAGCGFSTMYTKITGGLMKHDLDSGS